MVNSFKPCIVCSKDIEPNQLVGHHALHVQAGGIKISSDTKEFVVTTCAICNDNFTLNQMRAHTLKVHQIQISKYKAQHSMKISEKVLHQCQICGELVLHDYDSIGTHLGKHKDVTHKEYNERFMLRNKVGRQARQSEGGKAKQRKTETGKDLLAFAMEETFNLSDSPFHSPLTAGRMSRQWLSHEELHLAEWPHERCHDQAGVEVQVLDAQGLNITVA